ncbi:MAG TPA: PIG-L family deacetylase [Blastocatellia bacterium]|nr:PIG-L family deacetylase [Blastocatellia bacterium]
MKKILSLLLVLQFVAGALAAEIRERTREPLVEERGVVALDQALRDLSSPYTILAVAAHAEDIDRAALAYYRKKMGARTVIVLATRGDGMPVEGMEANEPARNRTREILEAARLLGADVMFLDLTQASYIATFEDVLKLWGQDGVAKLARAFKLFRPDVVITTHNLQSGSGEHRATARITLDAYEAAAAESNPALEGDPGPWQVRRVFQKADEGSGEAVVNTREYNVVRGETYRQMAQAAGQRFTTSPGRYFHLTNDTGASYYKLVRDSANAGVRFGAGFLDNLALPENLARSISPPRVGELSLLEALGQRDRLLEAIKEKLIEKRAEGSTGDLLARYEADYFRVVRFTEALERALALLLGVSLRISLSDATLVKGQEVTARLTVSNNSEKALPVILHTPPDLIRSDPAARFNVSEPVSLNPAESFDKEINFSVPKEAAFTTRFGSEGDETYYPVGSQLPGAYKVEPAGAQLVALAEVGLGQTTFFVTAVARFEIVPEVEITTLPMVVLKDWDRPREVAATVRLVNRVPGGFTGALWVVPLAVTDESYKPAQVSFEKEDQEMTLTLNLKLPIQKPPLTPDVLLEFRRERPAPPDAIASASIRVKTIGFDPAGQRIMIK